MIALKLMGLTHQDLLCKYSPVNLKAYTWFYTQAFQSWYELFSVEPTPMYIGEQFIWKNRFLTFDGKPFESSHRMFSEFHKAGILKVKDLFTKEGKSLTLSQLKRPCQCNINPMVYNSIFSSIPKEWKIFIDQGIKGYGIQEIESKILFRNNICPL